MNRNFHFAILRSVISSLVVSALCFFYYYQTNRAFIWFFLPISLIPLITTLIESKSKKSELNQEFLPGNQNPKEGTNKK
jgi:hypothetical protein